jgi:transposase
MPWTTSQERELVRLMKHARAPHVRIKAVALWNVGAGRSQREVAEFLGIGLRSVNRWVNRFRGEGGTALLVRPGRGRRPRVQLEELQRYVRQSPRVYGLPQTRWTLRALAQTVPSLKGFTDAGVYYALVRAGYRYKRGQPHLHSPDPEYEEKRGGWFRPSRRPVPAQGR